MTDFVPMGMMAIAILPLLGWGAMALMTALGAAATVHQSLLQEKGTEGQLELARAQGRAAETMRREDRAAVEAAREQEKRDQAAAALEARRAARSMKAARDSEALGMIALQYILQGMGMGATAEAGRAAGPTTIPPEAFGGGVAPNNGSPTAGEPGGLPSAAMAILGQLPPDAQQTLLAQAMGPSESIPQMLRRTTGMELTDLLGTPESSNA